MKIIDIKEVNIGHYITFRSTYNGVLSRKFYRILSKGTSGFQCETRRDEPNTSWRGTVHDTVIDNLFECPDDEVYSEESDLFENYPEDFI